MNGGTRPRMLGMYVTLALALGGSTALPLVALAAGFALLVAVVGAVALGSAFASSAQRRRACLRTLQELLRLAPWAARR